VTAARGIRRGFTLVEVLATMAFAAIVLPVALRGISLAANAAAETERRRQAAELAENKLSELAASDLAEIADMSGDFSPDLPEYRWTASIEDWDGAVVRELSVEVNWTFRGSERSVVLATLVYAGSAGAGE